MLFRINLWAIGFAGLALHACADTIAPANRASVQTLHSSAWCDGAEQSGIQLISAQQFSLLTGNARTFITNTDTTRMPAPDQSLLQLNMGQFASAGYAISIMHAEISTHELSLIIHWHEPAANALTAQMLSQPCVVVALDLRDIHHLQVIDQNRMPRFELTVP